ncbi:alpha/beta fold hydrolase [Phaeobacter sp. 22II1-1F12B]|uniref:alpha/beta fold hydrolase n=1 Tax=Phaeobacter sp. 22II1-1F12B TaxID=1317111 RepID=UPI00130378E4|nr:alpha/beta fold hydrolase [Phaeobacter sp. 22II1-1F12B]
MNQPQDGSVKPPREQVVLFGAKQSLCGIVTHPTTKTPGIPIVVLNTGIIHRVGHHRMYVTLARRWAAQGHPVVRFDFGGIGDSPVQSDELPPLDANLISIGEVCDWVESNLGLSRFVLIGLCSGADHSVIYAARDPRVAGVVLIDPTIPRTWQFFLRDTLSRLKRPVIYRNILSGRGSTWARIRHLFGGKAPEPRQGEFAQPQLETPEAIAFLEETYQKAVTNGAEMLAVFTGGHSFQHNYRRQLLDALQNVDFGEQLDLHYFKDSDHTFTYLKHRERLFALLDDWLEKKCRVTGEGPGKSFEEVL